MKKYLKDFFIGGLTPLRVFWILFFFSLILYFNTLNNQFIWDDLDLVVNNEEHFKNWSSVKSYLFNDLKGQGVAYYRPLLVLTHFFSYQLTGLAPFAHHFQNIIWHALAGLLGYYFFFLYSGKKKVSFLAALFFVVHPLQTEAISYISGRGDPVYTVFIFACLITLLKLLRAKKLNLKTFAIWRDSYFWWALLFFALALLSRERSLLILLLVPLLFLTEKVIFQKLSFQKLPEKIKLFGLFYGPFVLIAFIYLMIRLTLVFAQPSQEQNFTSHNISFEESKYSIDSSSDASAGFFDNRAKIILKGFFIYHRLLFFPITLVMDRSVILSSGLDWQFLAGASIFIFELALLIYFFRYKKKNSFLALTFFLFTLTPTFYVFLVQGILYEHWLYLPMLGFWFLIFLGLEPWFNRKWFWLLIILAITFFGFRVVERNRDWKNELIFFRKNVADGGGSYRVLHNLAVAYGRDGQLDQARKYFLLSLEKRPDSFFAMTELAFLAYRQNDLDSARQWVQQALEINADFEKAQKVLKLLDKLD